MENHKHTTDEGQIETLGLYGQVVQLQDAKFYWKMAFLILAGRNFRSGRTGYDSKEEYINAILADIETQMPTGVASQRGR